MTYISLDKRRMMLSAGLAACFGFAALAGQSGATTPTGEGASQVAAKARNADAATESERTNAATAETRSLAAHEPIAPPETVQAPEAPQAEAAKAPELPTPVAGLNQTQMNNAKKIVDTAKEMGLPERAQTIAIATALQESQLYNLASTVYAESYKYSTEGEGSDHDSVGLFQQRPQSGWGPVKDLMRPEFAARQFLKSLVQVPGWDSMPLTYAAQEVQVSAFPEAYSKHEHRAFEIVMSLQ